MIQYGNISNAIKDVGNSIIDTRKCVNIQDKVVFILPNVQQARDAKEQMYSLMCSRGIKLLLHNVNRITTERCGSYYFYPITQANSHLRGLSVSAAYADILNSERELYKNMLDSVEWQIKRYEFDTKKDNTTGFIYHCWCRPTRWIRERWKNTLEMFG